MKTAQKTKKLSEVKKLSKLRSLSLISLMSLVSLTPLQAQVKIGQDAAPVKGAVLELNSNTSDYIGGLRLTNVEITDIYVIPDEFSDKSFSEDDKLALKGAIVYNTNQYLQNELNELTGIGVYYWTGSKWVKETGGGTAIEPWNQVGTANQSFLNNQDSYLNAKVIIGEGADSKYFGAVNSEWAQLTVVGGDASINGIKVGTGRGNDHYNTAVGSGVLHTNEGGSHNSGLGIGALFSNTSGGENTALGANALGGNKTGNYNTAVGYQAFLNHSQSEGVMLDDGTGGWNTAIGAGTGSLGDSSTVVGTYALSSFSTGSRNTVLGMQAGRNIRKGSNNIAIGVNSYVPDGDANNQISIGNLIYGTGIGRNIWNDAAPGQGNVGIGTPAPQAKLDIAGQIQIQGGGPQENYVLTAVNEFGLAEWREPQGGSGAGSCLWEGMIGGNVYPKSYNTTKIVVGGTTPGLGSNAAQPWEPNSPAQFTVLGGDASINGLRVGRARSERSSHPNM